MLCADSHGAPIVNGFWIASYLRLDPPRDGGVMTDRARIRIAAAVTTLFLAAISAAGLAVRDDHRQATTAPATSIATPARTAATDTINNTRGDDDRDEPGRYEETAGDE